MLKKLLNWQVVLGTSLVALSALLHYVHFLVFGDPHHIFVYMLGDLAFIPLEVMIVAMVLHRILEAHHKRSMLGKLNMVVGAFFSEVGTELLARLAAFDPDAADLGGRLRVAGKWTRRDFQAARSDLAGSEQRMDAARGDLPGLKAFLGERRQFMLALLENPNLLEHESFTEMLWAVFHLTEEMVHRRDLAAVGENDRLHLAGDLRRAYGALIGQWLGYMAHLKEDYPYLFSLAVRTNPFDPEAQPELA